MTHPDQNLLRATDAIGPADPGHLAVHAARLGFLDPATLVAAARVDPAREGREVHLYDDCQHRTPDTHASRFRRSRPARSLDDLDPNTPANQRRHARNPGRRVNW